jgi:INO80 complex subunit C
MWTITLVSQTSNLTQNVHLQSESPPVCTYSAGPDMIIEAPPSVIPPKKYCDITGLEVSLCFSCSQPQFSGSYHHADSCSFYTQAPYIDPKSRLRYHNAEVYELIRTFVRIPLEFWLDQSHMYWILFQFRFILRDPD